MFYLKYLFKQSLRFTLESLNMNTVYLLLLIQQALLY